MKLFQRPSTFIFSTVFLFSLLFLVGCTSEPLEKKSAMRVVDTDTQRPMINGLVKGNLPPDFTVETLDGKLLTLDSFGDKPVLLYFFTTWCPYCTEDFTTLSPIFGAYESDVHIVAIDMDLGEDAKKIQTYRERFPTLTGAYFVKGNIETLSSYQIKYTTTKYAIAGNGTILYAGSGAFSKAQWLTLLDAMRSSGIRQDTAEHELLSSSG